ncbi:hypothetical protein, partial [Caballeronia zhejiangensis]|uniref:hypothetical protein n=1 Tax=Caballeronia zhejiangensis TaxID=871203 RepID=UPI001EF63F23
STSQDKPYFNFRLASLHQQQRNEIMKNASVRVNKNSKFLFLADPRPEPSTTYPRAHRRYRPLPLPSRSSNREGTEF